MKSQFTMEYCQLYPVYDATFALYMENVVWINHRSVILSEQSYLVIMQTELTYEFKVNYLYIPLFWQVSEQEDTRRIQPRGVTIEII